MSYPAGRDNTGLILYNADGYMMVTITPSHRPKFASNDLMGGTMEEKAAAFAGMVSYGGPYEVQDGKVVVHHLDVSSFPNFVGTTQERFYEFVGNRLRLSTAPILLNGVHQTNQLLWERVSADAR